LFSWDEEEEEEEEATTDGLKHIGGADGSGIASVLLPP
jgi:hypothetical protein